MWKTKIAAIALLWGTGIAHAYMPQAGTWVVTSELGVCAAERLAG